MLPGPCPSLTFDSLAMTHSFSLLLPHSGKHGDQQAAHLTGHRRISVLSSVSFQIIPGDCSNRPARFRHLFPDKSTTTDPATGDLGGRCELGSLAASCPRHRPVASPESLLHVASATPSLPNSFHGSLGAQPRTTCYPSRVPMVLTMVLPNSIYLHNHLIFFSRFLFKFGLINIR